jgi:integrase
VLSLGRENRDTRSHNALVFLFTFGLHSFRRTFALEVDRKTKDIFLVSKLLRHSKIEVTIRYLNVGNEELKARFLAASPADNLQ